jgi:hypothetical protein
LDVAPELAERGRHDLLVGSRKIFERKAHVAQALGVISRGFDERFENGRRTSSDATETAAIALLTAGVIRHGAEIAQQHPDEVEKHFGCRQDICRQRALPRLLV